MVNEKKHIKDKILKLLYDSGGQTISGVRISRDLGVSRVAVWKHITALKESGINIESRPKGYVLPQPCDLLQPFCFDKPLRDAIFYFPQLDSTMDTARSLAKKGAPHLSVVIAENQSGSRGRLNRKWFSSEGGLWMTLILKPALPPMLTYIYNFAASLSLSQTLRRMYSLDVSVKWPNDLLLDGKKLVGLLSEMETRGDMVEFVNIGIGINVNNNPEKFEPKAISLHSALGRKVSRKEILEHFIHDFEQRVKTIDCRVIIDQWKEETSTIGSMVRIETLNDVFEGKAVDVEESGALIIETPDGKQKKIIYGDCFHT